MKHSVLHMSDIVCSIMLLGFLLFVFSSESKSMLTGHFGIYDINKAFICSFL